jgi:general secretion pathway protein D
VWAQAEGEAAEAEEEATGLDYIVEAISVQDQSLTEFVTLLAELGQIPINVRNTVAKDIRVAINVPQPKTIRKVLDDLATQYDLWIEEQADGGVLIRPSTEKPEIEQRIVEKDFPLNFSRPSEVIDLIRNLLSDAPEADAIALDQLSVIRVRDIPEAVARIEEFLARVDRPQQTTVFPILYGDPELISSIILERLPDLEEGAMTVDLANSQILVRTTLDNLAEIQLLIETLDIKKEIRIFHIGFHPVDDVIAVLEDLELLSEEATITANEFTGKLIIQDTVERLDRIAEAIRAYDQPRPLVFFEAEILDVNADYNFTWDPRLALEDAAVPAAATGTNIQTSIQDGQTGYFVSGTDSFNFITLEANNYLAQLQANENDSDVRTIASPRVLVEMQEEARLNVGSEEPFGVRTFQGNVFGGGNDIFTSRVREVGVRLIIFVRNISDRGYVEFEVGLENSALGGRVEIAGDGTEGLRVLTTNVETVAIVKDNRTLVVGGLTQRMQSENSGGFPFLNKVPGIRYLFSSLSKQDQRRKLLMFITPRILNIDTPLEKYGDENDDELLLAETQQGDIAVPGTRRADLASTQVGSSAPAQWINRNGRWGYLDSDGKFVDRTEMYLEAYAEEEAPPATHEGFVEETEAGPSAADLLRQLEELSPGAETTQGGDVAHPRPLPDKSAPAPKSAVTPPSPPSEQPPAPQQPQPKVEAPAPPPAPQQEPAPQPPAEKTEAQESEPETAAPDSQETQPATFPKGTEATEALKKPAASLGKFNGTLGQLLDKVRAETGVLFGSEPGTMDIEAPVQIDGTGKTYGQVLMEALSGQNLWFTGRKDKIPLIRAKPQPRRAPAQPPAPEPEALPAPESATPSESQPERPAEPQPEQPADPQSRLDPNANPWWERAPQNAPGYAEDDRELTSSEWSALTDRASLRRVVTQAPRTTPVLEQWEVPVEVDTAPVQTTYTRLPHPDGYISRKHGLLSESVWGEMLDGDSGSLRPLEEPNGEGTAIPSRIRETASSLEADPWSGDDPGYRADTVSLIAPNESSTTTSSREKRGAWNKLKNIFTRN